VARARTAPVNASLRRRHRQATLALAAFGPIALAVALAARPPRPDTTLPDALVGDPPGGAVLSERADAFASLAIDLRVREGDADASVVELAPRVDPQEPDLLVYWAADGAAQDRLPDAARFLGRLAGTDVRRFALPTGARDGRIHLFSLGHGAWIDAAAIE